jgi:hypothetical protein
VKWGTLTVPLKINIEFFSILRASLAGSAGSAQIAVPILLAKHITKRKDEGRRHVPQVLRACH